MQETKTFYLPLERDTHTPPEVTIVVHRKEAGLWHAGLAVCSLNDHFIKKIGRKMAYHRLCGNPFVATTPSGVVNQIGVNLFILRDNRPQIISEKTINDLSILGKRLAKMKVR